MGLWGRRSGGEEFRRHFNAVKYRVQRAVESCLVLRHQLRVPVCEFHASDPAGQVVRESALPATQRRDDDKFALHAGQFEAGDPAMLDEYIGRLARQHPHIDM